MYQTNDVIIVMPNNVIVENPELFKSYIHPILKEISKL